MAADVIAELRGSQPALPVGSWPGVSASSHFPVPATRAAGLGHIVTARKVIASDEGAWKTLQNLVERRLAFTSQLRVYRGLFMYFVSSLNKFESQASEANRRTCASCLGLRRWYDDDQTNATGGVTAATRRAWLGPWETGLCRSLPVLYRAVGTRAPGRSGCSGGSQVSWGSHHATVRGAAANTLLLPPALAAAEALSPRCPWRHRTAQSRTCVSCPSAPGAGLEGRVTAVDHVNE